jgi:hypothetical protein
MEATARNIFNDYLKQSITYPAYSYPITYASKINYNRRTFCGKKEAFEQYEWFVSLMIFSMKELLDIYGKDRYWRMTAHRQLSYHAAYLRWIKTQPDDHNFVKLAGTKVNNMIDEILLPEKTPRIRALGRWLLSRFSTRRGAPPP